MKPKLPLRPLPRSRKKSLLRMPDLLEFIDVEDPHSAQPREPLRRMPTHQPPRVLTDSILQVARVFSGCASQCERSKWLRQRWHVAAEHHH